MSFSSHRRALKQAGSFLLCVPLLRFCACNNPNAKSRNYKPVSQSGKFTAHVTHHVAKASPYSGTKVWKIMIFDSSGKLLYEEPESQRPWHINNYWAWSEDDAFWVYNADIQTFLIFEQAGSSWGMRDSKNPNWVGLEKLRNPRSIPGCSLTRSERHRIRILTSTF